MTSKSHFKQSDLTRALRAAKQAGLIPGSCAIDENGTITLVFRGDTQFPPSNENPWDEELDNGPSSFLT